MGRSLFSFFALLVSCAFAGCSSEVKLSHQREPSLVQRDIRKGTGPTARYGDQIEAHYTGRLPDGKVIVSTRGERPHRWRLGDGTVIKGMDKAIKGMRVGGVRSVKMPPSLHWGSGGYGRKIPPNTYVTFEIELVALRS